MAVAFDFAKRECRSITPDAAPAACVEGLSCWIDLDVENSETATTLARLGVNAHAIEQALGPDEEGRHDIYDDCLHVAFSAIRFEGDEIRKSHVDVILARSFIVTIHRGPVEFVDEIRKTYQQDFQKFAKTLTFLLFEVIDHLVHNYRRALRKIGAQVEQFQSQIYAEVDDGIFGTVGRATRNLLSFRAILVSTRDVTHELATRRSSYVAETAQPFLLNMVGSLERLAADLAIERETLAEVQNLYMGIVSHRTNKVVNRLTVLSMVFLPLTFLCGVYGMNFHKTFPELDWEYGYPIFWVVVLTVAIVQVQVMRWKRWI